MFVNKTEKLCPLIFPYIVFYEDTVTIMRRHVEKTQWKHQLQRRIDFGQFRLQLNMSPNKTAKSVTLNIKKYQQTTLNVLNITYTASYNCFDHRNLQSYHF